MTFSTAPFTTVLGWCEKNKCSRIEITNLDNAKSVIQFKSEENSTSAMFYMKLNYSKK
jgi:hypothetical protein